MKRIFVLLVLMLTGCSINVHAPEPVVVTQQEEARREDLPTNLARSVGMVSVKARKSVNEINGTAFAYDEDHLITAGHVCVAIFELQVMDILEDNIKLTYLLEDVEIQRNGVEMLEMDESNDLCLMRLPKHNLKPVKFADYSTVKRKDKVMLVGAPLGFMMYEEPGVVINPSKDVTPLIRDRLIISAAAAGGNSGSPVFNDSGEVIGLLSMGHTAFDHLGICIPSHKIERFLRLVGK